MHRLLALAPLSFLLPAASSHADFTGVFFEPYVGEGWIENGYSDLATFRLYASFDGPDEGTVAVFGEPGFELTLRSSRGDFFNAPGGLDRLTAPSDLRFLGIWANQWDSYVTIGTDDALGDQTALTGGFRQEVGDLRGDFTTVGAAWAVSLLHEQRLADENGRVLLGQLTVAEGEWPCEAVINIIIDTGPDSLWIRGLSLGLPCPVPSPPDTLDVVFGALADGDVDDMSEPDDAYVRIAARPPFAPDLPSVAVELEGMTTTFPSVLRLDLEDATDAVPPDVVRRTLLLDFEADAWVIVDERLATSDDELVTIDVESPERFVQEGTGALRARLEYFDPGTLLAPAWEVRIDWWRWRVGPGAPAS